MAGKQHVEDGRLPPFCWVSIETIQELQLYFVGQTKANLATGIALYMGISFLLSTVERDGLHANGIRATRKEVGLACGLHGNTVTKYADHLIAAGVLELQLRDGGAYSWRLIEPDLHTRSEGVANQGSPPEGDPLTPSVRVGHTGSEGTNKEEQTTSEEEKNLPPVDAEVRRLCELMVELQNQRIGDREWELSTTGLEDMRRLIELDDRPIEEVERAIQWVHKHDFWGSNILSPGTLRKQFATIKLQAKQEGSRKTKSSRDVARQERTERRMRGEL